MGDKNMCQYCSDFNERGCCQCPECGTKLDAIPDINSWNHNDEVKLSEFGIAYVGYYFIRDNIRYIPYAGVKQQYQGKGFFKILLDAVKKDVRAVVLCNPVDITKETSLKQGYVFDDVINAMIWRK